MWVAVVSASVPSRLCWLVAGDCWAQDEVKINDMTVGRPLLLLPPQTIHWTAAISTSVLRQIHNTSTFALFKTPTSLLVLSFIENL